MAFFVREFVDVFDQFYSMMMMKMSCCCADATMTIGPMRVDAMTSYAPYSDQRCVNSRPRGYYYAKWVVIGH